MSSRPRRGTGHTLFALGRKRCRWLSVGKRAGNCGQKKARSTFVALLNSVPSFYRAIEGLAVPDVGVPSLNLGRAFRAVPLYVQKYSERV